MPIAFAGNVRTFQFFRAGRHITSAGQATEWAESDLVQICSNYAFQNKAPLVIGHPSNDGPSFGEVLEVFKKNGALYAVARCSKALIDLVQSGAYKHVSAAFEQFAPQIGWKLRHIGFLGSMAPSIKGLAPLEFNEGRHIAKAESPTSVFFAACPGMHGGIPEAVTVFTPPPGWRTDPASLPLYQLARNIHAGCPSMSFSEAASRAERLIRQ